MASEIRIDKVTAAGATSDLVLESANGDVVLGAPGGRVKNLNPEAGTIVQVAYQSVTTGGSAGASSTPDSTSGALVFSIPFTPKYATSLILVTTSSINIHEYTNNADNLWIGAWADTDEIAVSSGTGKYTSFASSQASRDASLHHGIASWGTTEKTISVRVGSNSGTVHYNYSDYLNLAEAYRKIACTVMEIAQ